MTDDKPLDVTALPPPPPLKLDKRKIRGLINATKPLTRMAEEHVLLEQQLHSALAVVAGYVTVHGPQKFHKVGLESLDIRRLSFEDVGDEVSVSLRDVSPTSSALLTLVK